MRQSMLKYYLYAAQKREVLFHFLLDRNGIEDFLLTDQGHDLRAYLGFDDGQFGAAKPLRGLLYHHNQC